MDSFLIKGSVPLHGEVAISGAKNAVLPIMAATLLTAEPCLIRRVPNLSDVKFMGQILTWLGARVRFEGDSVHIQARKIKGTGDYDLIRKMRGSICVMGPLLGRLKKAAVSSADSPLPILNSPAGMSVSFMPIEFVTSRGCPTCLAQAS